MTSPHFWNELTAPLKKLTGEIGSSAVFDEQLDRLIYYTEHFPPEAAKRLSRETLNSMAQNYRAALKLRLRIGGASILDLKGPISDPDWKNFQDELKHASSSDDYIFDLQLDKTSLLQSANISHPGAVIKLFLIPATLSRALSLPISQYEDGLMKEADGKRKLLLLIPDHEISLSGDYLAVAGGGECGKWQDYLAQTPPDRTKVEQMYDAARQSLKWVHFEFKHMTPLQLKVAGEHRPDDNIASAIYARLAAISVLYTADHASASATQWRATYAAQNYTAEVVIENAQATTAQSALALCEIAEWAYSDAQHKSDRLKVIQSVVAHGLQGNDPSENYRELLRKAVHFKSEVDWGWTAFIEGKLEIYFSRVREIEQVVDAGVKDFNEQIQSLTKTLTDNALAAVGVIVGSFIAALFGDKFNPQIFRFGVGLYAVYLLVFPGLIGLTHTWQRYGTAKDSFDKRKNDFCKRLSRRNVEDIIGTTVGTLQNRFKVWFNVTVAVYFIVIGLLAFAIWAAPALIKTIPALNDGPGLRTPKPPGG
jgi:hypothetical protein